MKWWGKKYRVGLDLGSCQIKLVQLRREKRGWTVDLYGIRPTPAGAISGGVIQQVSVMAAAIREMVNKLGVTERRVVVAIPGQQILLRHPILPPMSRRETRRALKHYAEVNLPIPLAEAVIDFTYLGHVQNETGAKDEFLLVATRRPVLDSLVQSITAAELMAEAVEVEPLALYRVFRQCQPDPNTGLTLLNLGASGTQVSFFTGDRWRFHRNLPWGTKELVNSAPGHEKINVTMVAEVARSWEFCQGLLTSTPVPPLVLIGGGTRLPAIRLILANNFTVVEDGPEVPGVNFPEEIGESRSSWLATYGVALGLALRGVS